MNANPCGLGRSVSGQHLLGDSPAETNAAIALFDIATIRTFTIASVNGPSILGNNSGHVRHGSAGREYGGTKQIVQRS